MNWTREYVMSVLVLLPLGWLAVAEAESTDYIHRDLAVNSSVVSYMPGRGIEQCHEHGTAVSTAGGKLGLGMRIDGVSATAQVTSHFDDGKFLVTVDLKPEAAGRLFRFRKQTFDLTDLTPTSVRLATTESGRVYQLNLTPEVREIDKTPRRLDVDALRLHNWRFPDCPVLVDDAVYVGRIACAQSPVAFLDISGIARVEFSLHELSDSNPWGSLDHGTVTLTHPDTRTTIQISGVRNGGPHALDLPGGPYRVWVRWSEPTLTVTEYWRELAKLRERIAQGEFPDARTDYLDKQLAQEPAPWIHSSGMRGLAAGERVDEAH